MCQVTLVIHAPDYRVKKDGAKSFEAVFADGIGVGYAIYPNDINNLNPGCIVVLLRKDRKKRRAEGRLVKLSPTGNWTKNGLQRYDVHFEDRRGVPYKSVNFNRCGVAVIYSNC